MHKFGVAKMIEGALVPSRFGRDRNTGIDQHTWWNVSEKNESHQMEDHDQMLWWCDSKEDAQVLITVLSNNEPKYKYLVFECLEVHTREIGPITISKFTEKGILPS